MKRTVGRIALVIVGAVLAGCDGGGIGASKPIGAEGGACTSGGACDPGLVCLSRLCVRLGDSGSSLPDSGGSLPVACESSALGGMGVPDGTIVIASGTYLQYLPGDAVDGDLTNQWNAGGYSGWLELDFPVPTAITGIHIAALAKPSADETFTITADGLNSPIGTGTRRVTAGVVPSFLAPIPVNPGTYSRITIVINGGLSWVSVADLSLLTSECPFVCGCARRGCGDDGCGTSCGTCSAGSTCSSGICI